MARSPKELAVVYSRPAQRRLDEIWEWNAQEFGRDHARRYVDFLRSEIAKLRTDYSLGLPVPHQPSVFHRTIRRKSKGHGHIVVYEVLEGEVLVVDCFHTAQDWQSKLSGGSGTGEEGG